MMQHRAFVFDYERFANELLPILEQALRAGDVAELERHIDDVADELCDPDEGEPIEHGWRAWLESKDVHELGDIALTRYYNPVADIGLGPDWIAVRDTVVNRSGTAFALLGRVIGDPKAPFDPGRMGSYVQSASDVRSGLQEVEAMLADGILQVVPLRVLLAEAVEAHAGLYITF